MLGVDNMEIGLEVVGELVAHLIRFPLPQQSVVDKDARELRADRLEEQGGSDRGIDAAGEAADHPAVADSRADRGHLLVDETGHRPAPVALRNLRDEVGDELRPALAVRDLGMELQAVDRAGLVADGRMRAGIRRGQRHELLVKVLHLVPVTHPDGRVGRHIGKERVGRLLVAGLVTELSRLAGVNLAPQSVTGRLHPVADTQDRNPEVEDPRVGVRRTLVVHTRRSTAEDQPFGGNLADAVG